MFWWVFRCCGGFGRFLGVLVGLVGFLGGVGRVLGGFGRFSGVLVGLVGCFGGFSVIVIFLWYL